MTDITVCQDLARPRCPGGEGAHALARRRPGPAIPVPPDCRELIRRGALVAVNSSAGKDSQCMTILLSRIVPREQMVVVHAPLAEVEWPGAVEHVENTLPDGVPLILAPVTSGKSLLDSIEERGRFPSPSVRWCTSSTKRGPIERELRRYLKAHPQFGGRLVNAMGMRAEESAARARKLPWKRSDRNSRAGRSWYDWLPIFDLTEAQVFDVIRAAGQSPHPAYGMGMSRLSCVFCIMASRADLRTAARLQPALSRRYVRLEERIGHTLSPTGVPLPALTGVPVEPDPDALEAAVRRGRATAQCPAQIAAPEDHDQVPVQGERPIVFGPDTEPPLFPAPTALDDVRPLDFRIVVRGTREGRLWNEFVARYHYLGYKTLVGAQMRYAIHDRNGWPIAMLGFSTAAWKLAPRDNFIGWTPQKREKNLPLVVDNPRFLILPWLEIPNLGSHILAIVRRRLPGDWAERYNTTPVLIETFVQTPRYTGAVYKASGWIPVGTTQGRVRWPRKIGQVAKVYSTV